jgi:hypothetical protein
MDGESDSAKTLPDYYAILGVSADADGRTIERAYERLAQKYQPDFDEPPVDADQMRRLDEAFDVLDVPAKRAEYDRALEAAGQTPAQPQTRMLDRRPVRAAVAAGALGAVIGSAVAGFLLLSGGGSQPAAVPPLRIVSPRQGERVTSPFTVEVASTHLIAAPEQNIPNAAHYHIFVDKNPFTAAGKVIPSDEQGVYHFASNALQLDLPPGFHTIILALGDNAHVRLHDPDAPAVSVDVIVVAPSPSP